MTRRVLGAIAALATLIALGLGIPMLLLATAGNPWPGRSTIDLRDAESITIAVLATITWIAWARFLVAVVVEATEQLQFLRRRVAISDINDRRIDVPPPVSATASGLLAHRLIAAALLLLPMARAIPAMASESVQLPSRPAGTGQIALVETSAAANNASTTTQLAVSESRVEVVVQRGDTLVGLAERHLRSAARWREIFELNQGVPQSDGMQLASPSAVRAGWTLRLPHDASVGDAVPPARPVEPAPRAIKSPDAPASAQRAAEYTVRAGDGPWDVAEALLGDGARFQEVLDANVGREVAPGVVWARDQRVIHPGWSFRWVPQDEPSPDAATAAAGSSRVVLVEPGDTLSEIVDEHTVGRPTADEIARVARRNDGTATPDGAFVFDADNPNLIHPGQEFLVDAVPTTGGPSTNEHRPPQKSERHHDDHRQAPAEPTPTSDRASKAERTSLRDRPRDVERAPTREPTPSSIPTTTSEVLLAPASDETPAIATGSSRSPLPIGLGAVALSSGLLAMLEMSRRRRLRGARTRGRLASPPTQVVDAERDLRSIGEPERLLRVDVAIRAAATAMIRTPHRIAAVLSDASGDVTVISTGSVELDPPWDCIEPTATQWVLPGTVDVAELADSARGIGAPCAAVTPVGVTPGGSDVLVDLEAAGTFWIDAVGSTADTVLTGIAAALSSSIFAESVHLIGVGVPDGAFLEHPNQHLVNSVDEALELACDLAGSTPRTADSTFALRARHTSGENWDPAVILVAEGHQSEIANWPPRRGVVLVAIGGEDTGAWTLRPSDEWWVLDALGLELTPLGLTAEELLAIDELIRWEPTADGLVADLGRCGAPPIGGEDHDGPVGADIEPSGRMVDAQSASDDQSMDRCLDHVTVDVNSTLEIDVLDIGEVIPNAHLNGTSHHSPVSSNGSAAEPGVESADDESEPDWDLMVRVFGLVDVVDREHRQAQFSKSKSVELLAWLGTHRGHATRAGARSALWDIDVRDATFANVVSEARRGLGRLLEPPAGADWVGRTLSAALPLHDRVIIDAELVEFRFDLAQRQAGQQALATLRSAVDLIRGMPFAETGYLWPDAEGTTSRLVVLGTSCTADLAERELAAGNLDGVFRATGVGLRVLPGHEELIGLRMRAHAARGDRAGVRQEWEAYERVLLADPWSDGEPSSKLVQLRHDLLAACIESAGAARF